MSGTRNNRDAAAHLVGLNHEVHHLNRLGRPPKANPAAAGAVALGEVSSTRDIYDALMEQRELLGVSMAELARRMHLRDRALYNLGMRMRNGGECELDTLVRIATALGLRLRFRLDWKL